MRATRVVASAFVLVASGCALISRPSEEPSQPPAPTVEVISQERAGETVRLSDVAVLDDGSIHGLIVNDSDSFVQNVRLYVRHTWWWRNERNPGEDNPSRGKLFRVREQIAPRGTLPFTYHPEPPLPKRRDGRFETSVEILGFSEVSE